MNDYTAKKTKIFSQCQDIFPEWEALCIEDVHFTAPKGFSSVTTAIQVQEKEVEPRAIFYRQLEGKENAILDFQAEKEVFLLLSENEIAAPCHGYEEDFRLEGFYQGRSLVPEDLWELDNLKKIANELHRFHQLKPAQLPEKDFFTLLHEKWGKLARKVLVEQRQVFPENEQAMCEDLMALISEETFALVRKCIPEGALCFCHNDTYHGNVMKLDNGDIKLLDFEFSCLNHKAFDFANLFAETVMKHKQPEYPFFRIAEPEYTDTHLSAMVGYYYDNETFDTPEERERAQEQLVEAVKKMIVLSDYMYSMAAIPLAVEPIQKIRFIPYAHARFSKFLRTVSG